MSRVACAGAKGSERLEYEFDCSVPCRGTSITDSHTTGNRKTPRTASPGRGSPSSAGTFARLPHLPGIPGQAGSDDRPTQWFGSSYSLVFCCRRILLRARCSLSTKGIYANKNNAIKGIRLSVVNKAPHCASTRKRTTKMQPTPHRVNTSKPPQIDRERSHNGTRPGRIRKRMCRTDG